MQDQFSRPILRVVLFIAMTANIVMVIVAVSRYPPLLTMPNSGSYILSLGVILLCYIIGIFIATKTLGNVIFLKSVILFGIAAGTLEIIHIVVENYGHLDPSAESISTGLFMIGLFLLFGLAGFVYEYKNGSIVGGMLGGAWSAVVCMVMVMTFGLSQLFWSFQVLETRNVGSPDFIRSGWPDLHAFTIADILESCFKVLFLGPVLGVIFGLAGATLSRLLIRKQIDNR